MKLISKTVNHDITRLGDDKKTSPVSMVVSNEQTRLDRGQRYVVCAFYTPAYRAHLTRLKASLDRLGLNFHLREYPPCATWEATTRLKPGFIVDCLESFPDFDILYVDADALIHHAPEFIDTVSSDVALLFSPINQRSSKPALSIAAGTLFIRNTPGGRRFAQTWRDQQTRIGPITRDEDMIYMAFPLLEGVSFTALPKSYSKVFDSPGPAPIIEHFQASRTAFKLKRWLRRAWRLALAITIIFALYGLWFFYAAN